MTGRNISLAQYVSACVAVAALVSIALLLFGFPLFMTIPAALLAGAKTSHENAYKLPLVERTLAAALMQAKG